MEYVQTCFGVNVFYAFTLFLRRCHSLAELEKKKTQNIISGRYLITIM